MPGPWPTVIDALCEHFPAISRDTWRNRFERGRVLGIDCGSLSADAPYRAGEQLFYYREVAAETPIPVEETMLHVDEHLIVVDKPHFLPVVPSGGYVTETLLARLVRRLGNPNIAPLHRLDRLTAGLVLFSAHPESRSRYQSLFRKRLIRKQYEAIASPSLENAFPLLHRSKLERGEPFFRTREATGEPNSSTMIDVIERIDHASWRYALEPVTGRKHQLRVHMAALGIPIHNDPLYPSLAEWVPDDFDRPLKLLARSLTFTDPLDGSLRHYVSSLRL
jgi:tRNA pseudouridine32 synthase / 23S rRNA pseudouridine746 synthase